MLPSIEQIKGVHPGYILERELRERHITKKAFAALIGEYEQVIGEITKRRRRINPVLSLKMDKALEAPQQGYFMLLQTYFDLAEAQKELNRNIHPDLSKIRKVIFWDTDFDLIDWIRNKQFVIERVYHRGNETEMEEMIRFYGKDEVDKVVGQSKQITLTREINRKDSNENKIIL
ncbi:MAG: hypothetical protein QM653_09900 [Dysgonomonas sp.]|uniref:helix-turn-helix transcriptional regulator n=1 Tax=Dysgonomonas sp. TaxID=1891233 RepID=UPI0039E697A3